MKISRGKITNLLSQAKDLEISGVAFLKKDSYRIANNNLYWRPSNKFEDRMVLYMKKTLVAVADFDYESVSWKSLSNIKIIQNMFWCELQRIEKEIEQKLTKQTSTDIKVQSNCGISNSLMCSKNHNETNIKIPMFLYFSCLISPIALSFLVFQNFIVFPCLTIAMFLSLYIASQMHKKQLKELKESTVEAKIKLLDKSLEEIDEILENN